MIIGFNNYFYHSICSRSSARNLLRNASVHSICAQPPPSPRATAGHLPALSVSGVGHLQFCAARGPGICQTRGFTQAFDTYAVPYQKITTQRILLEKQAYWLICQDSISLKKFQQNEKASNFFFSKVLQFPLPFQITTTNNKDIGIGIVQSVLSVLVTSVFSDWLTSPLLFCSPYICNTTRMVWADHLNQRTTNFSCQHLR